MGARPTKIQGEMELKSKSFSYYIEQNEPLVLRKFSDDASIIQADGVGSIKSNILTLYLIFHPDKVQAKDRLKAEAVFHQLIYPAVRRMLNLSPAPAAAFSDLIDELIPAKKIQGKEESQLSIKNSFDEIFLELERNKVHSLHFDRQYEILKKQRLFALLKAKADTPNQYLRAAQFIIQNNIDQKEPFKFGNPFSSLMLQAAVNAGHPEAILLMVRYISLGHYGESSPPLIWAINAMRSLGELLKTSKPGDRIRQCSSKIEALRQEWDRDNILPYNRPVSMEGTERYNQLFQKLRDLIKKSVVSPVSFPALLPIIDLIPLINLSGDRHLEGNFLATNLPFIHPPTPEEAALAIASVNESALAPVDQVSTPVNTSEPIKTDLTDTNLPSLEEPSPDVKVSNIDIEPVDGNKPLDSVPSASSVSSDNIPSKAFGFFNWFSWSGPKTSIPSASAVEVEVESDDDYELVHFDSKKNLKT